MIKRRLVLQGHTVYSTGNSTQCHVAAWMRKGSGGQWIHVYAWLSHSAEHLKLLLIGYEIKVLVAQSCLTLCDPMDLAHQAPQFMECKIKKIFFF